jgi:hypothetical protein
MTLDQVGLVLATALALGCGAGGIAVDGGDPASETGEVPVDACIDDGQLGRALAIMNSDAAQVHVFEPGRAELILPAPLPEGVDSHPVIWAVSSPGFIAVTTNYSIFEPELELGSVLRLYDREAGALVWSHEVVARLVLHVYLDGEGRAVAQYGWNGDAPTPAGVVIDGEAIELPTFAPRGPLGSDDWMPGFTVDANGTYTAGALYQPFSDELIVVTENSVWAAGDQTVEYIDETGPVPEFVLARPDASERIELSPFAGQQGLVEWLASAGDYRLLSMSPKLVRLQVATHELLEIDITPPPGLEPFDCYSPNTTVDTSGRILLELRDAGAAQIHAWDPESGTWTALGVPVTAVDDVGIQERFGRVETIYGHGTGMTDCPHAEWSDPPAGALASTSLQLARVEPPLSMILDVQTIVGFSVDPTERCATWRKSNGQVVHDLDDGEQLTLDVSGVSGMALWLD